MSDPSFSMKLKVRKIDIDPQELIEEASNITDKFSIMVETKVKGIKIWVYPDDSPFLLFKAWEKAKEDFDKGLPKKTVILTKGS